MSPDEIRPENDEPETTTQTADAPREEKRDEEVDLLPS
jgi:hypothetical protein